jgi:alpha-L-fucosidase 2
MARGGFEVDIDWENGTLKQARVISKLGNPLNLSYNGKTLELGTTERGKSYLFTSGQSGLSVK